MDVMAVLRRLYPNADDVMGFVVVGGKLVDWNLDAPRPTDQQLADAWMPALKARKIAEIRARVVSECEALMPVYEMLYCVRVRVVDPRLAQMDVIAAKGHTLEARVNAAATEADVLAVVW